MRAELHDLPQGWFHHGEKILDLIEQRKPKVCVELGSWRGASAIAIGRLIRQWGGTLTCVDTWTGEVNGGTAIASPAMLAECAHNLVAAGVSSSIRLIPALTVDAALWWHGPIDFLYVDADHSYASTLADIEQWVKHVRPGGLIAGDDYDNPLYPGVKQAWDHWEELSDVRLARYATPNTNPLGMKLVYGELPS